MIYFLIFIFTYLHLTDAYLLYYITRTFTTEKHYINDNIPKWNVECFEQKEYIGYLCKKNMLKTNCILYVNCENDECSTNDVQTYHQYAIDNNIQGIVFTGNPPKNAKCFVASTFINNDIDDIIELNYKIELGYELEMTSMFNLGIGLALSLFLCVFVYAYFKKWTLTYINRGTFININDNIIENESYESDHNDQTSNSVRILVNDTYQKASEDVSINNIPTCAICLEYFQDGDTISKLNCGHEFKYECIREWLKKDVRCPLCNSTE